MRLFFSMDGDTKYQELDTSKLSLLPGDVIVTHDEESQAFIQGMMLIDNIPGIQVMHFTQPKNIIEKPVSAIVFFSKIPQDISIKRHVDSVTLTVSI